MVVNEKVPGTVELFLKKLQKKKKKLGMTSGFCWFFSGRLAGGGKKGYGKTYSLRIYIQSVNNFDCLN